MKVYVSDRLIYVASNSIGELHQDVISARCGGAVQFAYRMKAGQYVKVSTTEFDVEFRVDD